MERLHSIGGRVVALGDAAYPLGLRDLRDPPAFLCVRGELPRGRTGGEGTAIVGMRDASAPALERAFAFAARVEAPVVSGLARGIDAAAHRGALAARVPTIAYVGSGLDLTYPPEHEELQAAILAAGGAIASERLPGSPVTRWALTRRDRLQAAHARRAILVESDEAGGAMHTMRFATELQRERLACEPRPDGRYDGNARAIRDGAQPLSWEDM
ncbi:MAG TPA: DNA-processing protein DprA [Candidatus Acidoferrales bacterium]|nr:DNA-processing protein DprA [Candidatus Acidoferrales bacterium]